MWHTKNAFFREMHFWSHCYTVVSYQALFRLSVFQKLAVHLLGAENVCFCTIRDFGSLTKIYTHLYEWRSLNRHDVFLPKTIKFVKNIIFKSFNGGQNHQKGH